jgi:hypothetical protein
MAANLVVFLTVFIVATALLIAGDAVARCVITWAAGRGEGCQ